MVYEYNIKNEQLSIDLELAKNRAKVFFTGVQISDISNHKQLSNGKMINLGTNDQLFIKFINQAEGFTIMLNNIHIRQSAGHPKNLLKRTLNALRLGALIFSAQLIYVLFDLWEKNEFSPQNFSVKTILYLTYFATIIVGILIAVRFAKRGNWKGVALGFILLLLNLLFSIGLGLNYYTRFSVFLWSFLTTQVFVLILLFIHTPVIKYVRDYTRSLNRS